MPLSTSQTFENHARFVPAFHYFALPVLGINLAWSIYHLVRGFSADTVLAVALAAALIVVALYGRLFALTVQDRVIRLEMELRLEKLLPAELRPRIGELTVGQLVSLRFAPDGELPALTRKVLDEKMLTRKAIKQLIQQWKSDLLRA
ncbi:MAG: hypothetical protein GZ088_12065 [Acidipila sp.]|nr:hypothetical protein [Acidipila sp.]